VIPKNRCLVLLMWMVKFEILFHPFIFSRLQESLHHCPSDCSDQVKDIFKSSSSFLLILFEVLFCDEILSLEMIYSLFIRVCGEIIYKIYF